MNLPKIIFGLLIIFLIGCTPPHSYSYDELMMHPPLLQTEIQYCQARTSSYCSEVNRAAGDFMKLALEQQNNPEKFGERILQEQMNSVENKIAIQIWLAVIGADTPEN